MRTLPQKDLRSPNLGPNYVLTPTFACVFVVLFFTTAKRKESEGSKVAWEDMLLQAGTNALVRETCARFGPTPV